MVYTANKIIQIRKRDDRIVEFSQDTIAKAIFNAMRAVSEPDMEKAETLSDQVLERLNRKFHERSIPAVEEIQDLVEEILIENKLIKVAKAYIIYRDQHAKMRDLKSMINSDDLMESYLKQLDWKVRENSNMDYSLQGLNNYVSSTVSANYWLNKVYSPDIRDAHVSGDFHIHDLQLLAPYCCGWDFKDILLRGFGGVRGKVESKAPKHFGTALSQLVNFFYTLQGEAAGAQAVSSLDTYIAPFVRYDNLNYEQVKQQVQMFLYNINVPTRVGFQCLSADTEILGEGGWVKHNQLKKGDKIATFNIKEGYLEYLPVKNVFAKQYSGRMYNLKNRISDQLISPEHRVVRRKFNGGEYVLEKIEDVLSYKSPFIVPVGSNGHVFGDDSVTDDAVRLMAWIISEGSFDRGERGSGRVSIYQSPNKSPDNYHEIISICRALDLKYTERTQTGLGDDCAVIRFDAASTRKILNYFKSDKEQGVKFVPDCILRAGVETAKLFLETYIKGDGHDGCKITTTSKKILDGLLQVAVNAGFGATVLVRRPDNALSKKDRYIIRLIKHHDTYINKVKAVDYQGIIWCPNTDNETVIARRNGKIFITGNTPFTNVTMDLFVPPMLASEPVIIGGELQKETYGEFQKEMDMFNTAFIEVMVAGDKKGRVLSWPIPTYNVTKDWNWESPVIEKIMEMTAKYGIPYFSNFVNSDMKPEDARSMCPLAGTEKVLIASSRGRGLEYSEIRNIFEGNSRREKYYVYADGRFVAGRFNKFINQKMIKVVLENGHEIKMSRQHLNFVRCETTAKEEVYRGGELKPGMYLPYSLNVYQGDGGNSDFGFFVGAFAGDGSFDGDSSVVFSLENHFKKKLINKLQKIAKKYFGAGISIISDSKTKLVTLKIHSRAAVGLCRDFVEGKERNKCYRARLYSMSVAFRRGVVAGHYATDGGNRHRIYTSSRKMVETLNLLAATLGTTTSVYEDNRSGRFGKEPNYAVLFYQLNRKRYGNLWFKKGTKLWMKIKQVQEIENSTAYCFEVDAGEPLFTIGTTGVLTHNCRLRLDNRELRKRGGGLFGANPLTGSIGVVTINMARLGHLSKTKEEFFERLAVLMDLAKASLKIKRNALEKFTEGGLYPYSRVYLSSVKERFNEYWKNHFNTIGLNGVNEACLNLLGSANSIASDEGHKFARQILDFMRERMMDYQNETNELFNLEATPAEGTAYRFARLDVEKYPEIIVANSEAVKNSGAAPYYTNSTQLPVGYTDDIFEALRLQDDLQTRYTGGTVLHGFVGERMPSADSTKSLVKKIAENFHLPYFTITPTFSVCPVHGYLEGEFEYCPLCDEEMGYAEGISKLTAKPVSVEGVVL